MPNARRGEEIVSLAILRGAIFARSFTSPPRFRKVHALAKTLYSRDDWAETQRNETNDQMMEERDKSGLKLGNGNLFTNRLIATI